MLWRANCAISVSTISDKSLHHCWPEYFCMARFNLYVILDNTLSQIFENGCQSRHTNVDVTTAQFAGRMIGPSGVSGPPGDVTGIGGAAIVKRRLLRVEESASSLNEAPS